MAHRRIIRYGIRDRKGFGTSVVILISILAAIAIMYAAVSERSEPTVQPKGREMPRAVLAVSGEVREESATPDRKKEVDAEAYMKARKQVQLELRRLADSDKELPVR